MKKLPAGETVVQRDASMFEFCRLAVLCYFIKTTLAIGRDFALHHGELLSEGAGCWRGEGGRGKGTSPLTPVFLISTGFIHAWL